MGVPNMAPLNTNLWPFFLFRLNKLIFATARKRKRARKQAETGMSGILLGGEPRPALRGVYGGPAATMEDCEGMRNVSDATLRGGSRKIEMEMRDVLVQLRVRLLLLVGRLGLP